MPLPPRGRPSHLGTAALAVPRRSGGRGLRGGGEDGNRRSTGPASGCATRPVPTVRFPALDAVRGLAALAVVAFHAYKDLAGRPEWDTPLGTLAFSLQWAVPVFFVLSGFLLYRPFAAALAGGRERPATGPFLLRRAGRILPGYWLALVVFGTLAQPDRLWSPDGLVRYGLLLQVFDADTVYHVLGTAWSLSIEFAFYLALPVLAWLVARLLARVRATGPADAPDARPRRVALVPHLALIGLLTAAAITLRNVVVAPVLAAAGGDPNLAGFSLPGSFQPFATGMALAVVTVSRRELLAWLRDARHHVPRRIRVATVGLLRRDGPWLGLALLAFSFALVVEPRHVAPWSSTDFATLAATAALAPLVLRPTTSRAARLLGRSRSLVALGAVSYGLYLWHWPIQELARTHGFAVEGSLLGWAFGFAVMATLGTCAAWVSYRLIEAPINARVRAATGSRPAAAPSPEGAGGLESGPTAAPPLRPARAAEGLAQRGARGGAPRSVAGAES
ncbi:MAG TPA: acyltransferase [Candidatus Limnocylindrales bacterium]|nr:acyltransferase [Candidatus Limnocylindrales bacterium]